MKTRFFLTLLILFSASCSYFIETFGDPEFSVTNIEDKKLSLVFSHNILGETHPCGCRHHPLGGLPQFAGKVHEIQSDHPTFYVDTGDTLFDTNNVPVSLRKSLLFKAQNLAKGLDLMKLKFFVPGDFDLAEGVAKLDEIIKERNFATLLSNLKDDSKYFSKNKKFHLIQKGPHNLFLVGVLDPSLIRDSEDAKHFKAPRIAINEVLELIKKKGYKEKNPFHRLILLSHSGFEEDRKLAKTFPMFDWIIGAHSQKFLRTPSKVGKTKIVQVLSRNHYLGEIVFDLTKDRSGDQYLIHEMRDEQKDKLKPNPFLAWIGAHKEELKKIQVAEQDALFKKSNALDGVFPYNTANSCMECHSAQGDFWQGTAHSIAYGTLIKAKEENNMSCLKCHSVGNNDPKGYRHSKKIAIVNDALSEQEQAKNLERYMRRVDKAFDFPGTVRDLSTKQTKKIAKDLSALEEKYKITHNFANVQCLNCHDKHVDHPFENFSGEKKTVDYEKKYKTMQGKCLSCHDSDQSPEWYEVQDNGLPGKLSEAKFVKKLKAVACPKDTD
ncbi:MAG: multiheme c-type cytochrome [Bacteriovoracaceae bacterium]